MTLKKLNLIPVVAMVSAMLLALAISGCSQSTSPYSSVLGDKSHDHGGYGRSYDGHNTDDDRDDENHNHRQGGSSYGGHNH